MPAYKGTKELPKASNKQARMMFTSMQKDREAMAKGRPDSVQRGEKGEQASMKKMAKGGSFRASANGIAKKGKTKAMMPKMACGGKMKGYAKGGSVSSRADGCATKGKTNTKMVKMASGGSLSGMGLHLAPVAAPSQSASMAAAPGALQSVNRMPAKLSSSGPSNMTPTQSASGNPGQVMRANASRNPQNMGARFSGMGRKKGGMVGKKKGGKC